MSRTARWDSSRRSSLLRSRYSDLTSARPRSSNNSVDNIGIAIDVTVNPVNEPDSALGFVTTIVAAPFAIFRSDQRQAEEQQQFCRQHWDRDRRHRKPGE